MGDDTPMVFVATSPTRFRIESMNGTATFRLSKGRAMAVVLEQPGAPSLTLTREGS